MHITHDEMALVCPNWAAYLPPRKAMHTQSAPAGIILGIFTMAAIDFRSASVKSGFSVSSLIGTLVSWNDARMTRKSLNKLTARELDDIGLVRGDIEDIARGNLIR